MFDFKTRARTVDEAINQFTEALESLERVAVEHIEARLEKQDQIADLQKQVEHHQAESNRAKDIAAKIRGLLGE